MLASDNDLLRGFESFNANARCCLFLDPLFLVLAFACLSFVEKVTGSTDVKADEGESSKTTPKAKKTKCDVGSIRGLVQAGRYGEAIDQWEWACIQDRASFRRYVAWDVAQAYV